MSQLGLLPLARVGTPSIPEVSFAELEARLVSDTGERVSFAGPETGVISTRARDRGSLVAERSIAMHASFDGLPPIFQQLAGSQDGPSQDQLKNLLTGFAGLNDKTPALEMMRARPPLAETLALFGPLGGENELMTDKAASLSRCHLAVNTDADPPAKIDAGEALLFAASYAKTLGYQALFERGGRLIGLRSGTEIDLAPHDARKSGEAQLRSIGRLLNERHFQNGTIIPPDRIPTAPDSKEYRHENAYWCSHLANLA